VFGHYEASSQVKRCPGGTSTWSTPPLFYVDGSPGWSHERRSRLDTRQSWTHGDAYVVCGRAHGRGRPHLAYVRPTRHFILPNGDRKHAADALPCHVGVDTWQKVFVVVGSDMSLFLCVQPLTCSEPPLTTQQTTRFWECYKDSKYISRNITRSSSTQDSPTRRPTVYK
jgi:hypothetical protein